MDKKFEKHLEKMKNMDDDELMGLLHREVCGHVMNIRNSRVAFAICMKVILDGELYKRMGYATFDIYCCDPDINIAPATVMKYIRTVEVLQEKGVDPASLAGIGMSTLFVMRAAKEPAKYLQQAKDMPYSDFKKVINKKEKGIDSEDKEIEDYIKKKEKECQFWVGEKCIEVKRGRFS